MSLATRCTECGTAFRVVQDQLKVSGGWVRCGRCDGVFDASLHLFDLTPIPAEVLPPAAAHKHWVVSGDDTATPDSATDEASVSTPPAPLPTDVEAGDVLHVDPPSLLDHTAPDLGLAWLSAPPAGAPGPVTSAHPTPLNHDGWLNEAPVSLLSVPASPPLAPVKLPVSQAEHDTAMTMGAAAAPAWQHASPSAPTPTPSTKASELEPANSTEANSHAAPQVDLPPPVVQALREDIASANSDLSDEDLAQLDDANAAEPSFIIQARKRARYQHWAWKLLGGSLVVIAATGLVGQWVHHERDTLQAKYPSTQRWLSQWCQVWSCRLQAPARLSDVAIDSSGLSKVAGSKQLATLQVTLRNQVAWPVAWPAIELTLTDAQGAVISRRILSPKELNATTPAMGADAEVSLQAVIDTGSTRTVGYAVEAFYP